MDQLQQPVISAAHFGHVGVSVEQRVHEKPHEFERTTQYTGERLQYVQRKATVDEPAFCRSLLGSLEKRLR